MQILAVAPGNEIECRESIKRICDAFAVSEQAKEIEDHANEYKKNRGDQFLEPIEGVNLRGYRATWCTQFRAVLWRSWLTVLKEPLLVKVRMLQTIIVSLLIGVIFFGQVLDQNGVMNINGGIFLFLTNMTFQNVFAVIDVFCNELPVFLRESRAKLYRTDAYFLGKMLAELPLFIAVPVVFTSIAYPMIGLRPGMVHFSWACLTVILVANVSTSFGYFISCASSSTSMALSVGPPLIIPFLLFGGFFLNSGSVPKYFEWLSYLSWFRFGNEALLINQWDGVLEGEIFCNRLNSTCPASGNIILETLNFKAVISFFFFIVWKELIWFCFYFRVIF